MSHVYRGTSFHAIRRKLPRNLVIFDGKCNLTQARVQFVLERNFTFFDEHKLERNKMLFASIHSMEGKEIERHFPVARCAVADAAAKPSGSGASRATEPAHHAIILVELVPSRRSLFLKQRKIQSAGGLQFTHSERSASAVGGTGDAVTEDATSDIRVSVRFTAACRIAMKLDRLLLRWLGWLGYGFVPRRLGDALFDAYVSRRRVIWERSDTDVMVTPAKIVGLKERTWRFKTSSFR